MTKNRFEFKEHEPLAIPFVMCRFCNAKMTQNQVKANELMKAKEEDYICERCYREANTEQFESYEP